MQSTDLQVNRLHVFCDFDGTIASLDIGDGIFDRFGEREPWHTKLMNGELGIREYWLAMATIVREPLTLGAIDEYLRSVPIDPGAHELVEFLRASGIPLTIVSDGFDLYINRYLELNGLSGIDVWCNDARLDEEGRLQLSFPRAAEGCECMCASCKRNVVLLRAHPDERIVYIGDGPSDYCPAEHADIIFAKKKLAAYCNEHRLPHYPFGDLSDVAAGLRRQLERRRVRVRNQAALRRRKAWEGE